MTHAGKNLRKNLPKNKEISPLGNLAKDNSPSNILHVCQNLTYLRSPLGRRRGGGYFQSEVELNSDWRERQIQPADRAGIETKNIRTKTHLTTCRAILSPCKYKKELSTKNTVQYHCHTYSYKHCHIPRISHRILSSAGKSHCPPISKTQCPLIARSQALVLSEAPPSCQNWVIFYNPLHWQARAFWPQKPTCLWSWGLCSFHFQEFS